MVYVIAQLVCLTLIIWPVEQITFSLIGFLIMLIALVVAIFVFMANPLYNFNVHPTPKKTGALIVIENIIDDDRRQNAFGLMMSLNMAIETEEGFDFTASDFDGWAKQVGFKSTKVMPLTGPSSAVIAIK